MLADVKHLLPLCNVSTVQSSAFSLDLSEHVAIIHHLLIALMCWNLSHTTSFLPLTVVANPSNCLHPCFVFYSHYQCTLLCYADCREDIGLLLHYAILYFSFSHFMFICVLCEQQQGLSSGAAQCHLPVCYSWLVWRGSQ